MKRVAAVFLLATPVWAVSGVAGWWLGGGKLEREDAAPALAPSKTVVAPLATVSVARSVNVARPKAVARAPIAPKLAPQMARPVIVSPPEVVVAAAPPGTPAPPAGAAAPEPVATLGSTDVTAPEKALAPAPTPAVASAGSDNGVLIVVSLASQKAFVFKDGELWGSSTVSTGRSGKRTPVGRYTILEKQVHHISRKYDNAPMPYMQRLTWGGVAMHAGHVTGRPASHGCIRLPRSFAKKLYNLTNFSSTTVVVTDRKARSSKEAREAA